VKSFLSKDTFTPLILSQFVAVILLLTVFFLFSSRSSSPLPNSELSDTEQVFSSLQSDPQSLAFAAHFQESLPFLSKVHLRSFSNASYPDQLHSLARLHVLLSSSTYPEFSYQSSVLLTDFEPYRFQTRFTFDVLCFDRVLPNPGVVVFASQYSAWVFSFNEPCTRPFFLSDQNSNLPVSPVLFSSEMFGTNFAVFEIALPLLSLNPPVNQPVFADSDGLPVSSSIVPVGTHLGLVFHSDTHLSGFVLLSNSVSFQQQPSLSELEELEDSNGFSGLVFQASEFKEIFSSQQYSFISIESICSEVIPCS